jgi:hypothetical protein
MHASPQEALSPSEQEQFSAMVERMRQLRRRSGVPDGVTVEQAVALHFISAEQLERARWGNLVSPTPEERTA